MIPDLPGLLSSPWSPVAVLGLVVFFLFRGLRKDHQELKSTSQSRYDALQKQITDVHDKVDNLVAGQKKIEGYLEARREIERIRSAQ